MRAEGGLGHLQLHGVIAGDQAAPEVRGHEVTAMQLGVQAVLDGLDVAGDGGFVSGVFWQLLRAFFIKFKMAGTILLVQSFLSSI